MPALAAAGRRARRPTATVIRENLVRFDRLPLVVRVADLPRSRPTRRCGWRSARIDLLAATLECRVAASGRRGLTAGPCHPPAPTVRNPAVARRIAVARRRRPPLMTSTWRAATIAGPSRSPRIPVPRRPAPPSPCRVPPCGWRRRKVVPVRRRARTRRGRGRNRRGAVAPARSRTRRRPRSDGHGPRGAPRRSRRPGALPPATHSAARRSSRRATTACWRWTLGISRRRPRRRADDPLRADRPQGPRTTRDRRSRWRWSTPRPTAKPTKADVLAQANLDGGGNTDADRRAKTPLPVLPKNSAQTSRSRSRRRRSRTLEQQTRELHDAAAQRRPSRRPPQAPTPSAAERTDLPTANELMQKTLEAMRLEAQIAKDMEAYQKRPKRRFVGARAEEYRFARYVEDWRLKIERIGNLNYPEAARQQKLYGSLLLTVSIRADGSVETVEVNRSRPATASSTPRRCASSRCRRPIARVPAGHQAGHRHPAHHAHLDVHQGRRAGLPVVRQSTGCRAVESGRIALHRGRRGRHALRTPNVVA